MMFSVKQKSPTTPGGIVEVLTLNPARTGYMPKKDKNPRMRAFIYSQNIQRMPCCVNT